MWFQCCVHTKLKETCLSNRNYVWVSIHSHALQQTVIIQNIIPLIMSQAMVYRQPIAPFVNLIEDEELRQRCVSVKIFTTTTSSNTIALIDHNFYVNSYLSLRLSPLRSDNFYVKPPLIVSASSGLGSCLRNFHLIPINEMRKLLPTVMWMSFCGNVGGGQFKTTD